LVDGTTQKLPLIPALGGIHRHSRRKGGRWHSKFVAEVGEEADGKATAREIVPATRWSACSRGGLSPLSRSTRHHTCEGATPADLAGKATASW
jgi:hypothetical protein